MIRKSISKFQFDYLFKIDCNIFEYKNKQISLPLEIHSDLFREDIIEKIIFDDYFFKDDYIGSVVSCIQTNDALDKWAKVKNLNVKKLKVCHHVPFFAGKFYGISRSVCEFVAQHGESNAKLFVDDYGGAEDVYIGYMFSKYNNSYFNFDILLNYIENIESFANHTKTKQYLKRLIYICDKYKSKFEFEQRNCVHNTEFNEKQFDLINNRFKYKLIFLGNGLKI